MTSHDHRIVEALTSEGMTPAQRDAFALGYADGLASPDDLSSGMTYPDASVSEAYDHGVNVGQSVARYRKLRA